MRPISGLSSCAARSRMMDARAALLVASPGSGPPGSPNLSPRVSAAPLERRQSLGEPITGDLIGRSVAVGLEPERPVDLQHRRVRPRIASADPPGVRIQL